MYKILGFINVALLVGITSPYWLRYFNQWFFDRTNPALAKWIKRMRTAHKPLGVCLLVLAFTHGYLALSALQLHTGSAVGVMIFATVLLGALYFREKKAVIFAWHKHAALITVILVLIHLISPNLF
jgi:cytochrome b561